MTRHAIIVGVAVLTIGRLGAGTIRIDTPANTTPRDVAYAETGVSWHDADPTDDVACTVAFAACELQDYLRAITGQGDDWQITGYQNPADARVVVLRTASGTEARDLGPEGYRITSSPTETGWAVYITGGGRVGALYGVYDFLHRLGVRWFAPGGINEEVPRRSLESMPELDIIEQPAFQLRGFHAWENRGNEAFLLWMARNRLNYWCVQQQNKPLMHKLGIHLIGGGHRLTDWYLGPHKPYPYNHPAFTGDEDKSTDPYARSPDFKGDVDRNGVLTYFEAHPEWYALRDGTRSDRIRGDGGDNFCTSNGDAMAEWVKNAVTDLAEGRNRDATLMNAWMLDAGKWCQCDACKRQGTRTDRNLCVIHAYADAIKEAQQEGRINRKIRLLFLAYADVLEPPSKPLPEGFDYSMCIATYFPIARCYVHTLRQKGCGRNARYWKHLQGWALDPDRHYKGQLCIGEYYNVSGYKCLPICFMHTMQEDIPAYYDIGARYFHYMHCTTQNWGNKALTNWQMARQLWNPNTDCAPLWHDYFSGRYGPAAESMRAFYESLETMLCNVTELKYNLARRLDRQAPSLYPGGHLRYERSDEHPPNIPSLLDMRAAAQDCREMIDDVLALDLPDRIRHRVAEDERLFTYGERTLTYFDLASQAIVAIREGRTDSARQQFAQITRLAEKLRNDTESTRHASSHANAPNAFAATYATGVMNYLSETLGPIAPENLKTLVPEKEPLILTHLDLRGGGAQRYTYGFCKYPGRIPISKTGNFAYGQGTGTHSRIRAWFTLEDPPETDLYMTLIGALTPIHGETSIPGTVVVNDHLLFTGDMPFVEGELRRRTLRVPPGIIEQEANWIELRNTHPDGRLGNRPWYGIDRIEVSTERPEDSEPMPPIQTPADLQLTYRSDVDRTMQPYRVYLPSAYDGKTPMPVLIIMHGTGGTKDTYFESESYGHGIYVKEAERQGIVLVSPHGRGTTEYRGIGENDVLTIIETVKHQFCVDPDRIVCSGQSMGGTGTSYLCTRYPDLFAGGIPLASGYCHVNLLENLRHVPMLYIQGENDWPIYAQEGPNRITAQLRKLACPVEDWVVPGQPHNTMSVTTEWVIAWALQQRRVDTPKRIVHSAYLPIHGRAYWTEQLDIAEAGPPARLEAEAKAPALITLKLDNLRRVALYPDRAPIDTGQSLQIEVDGTACFDQLVPRGKAVVLTLSDDGWNGEIVDRQPRPYTAYRTHAVGTVASPPTTDGHAGTTLGNWMTDMIRHATGADLAICNHRHYRGVRLRENQTVFLVDLYDWLRPFARRLATFQLRGEDLLEILDANVLDGKDAAEYLVQVSGCRYSFDRSKPTGQRIVDSDVDPKRTYTIACEPQILTRETMHLGGRFGSIHWRELQPTTISAAWRYILDNDGVITASTDRRVQDVTP